MHNTNTAPATFRENIVPPDDDAIGKALELAVFLTKAKYEKYLEHVGVLDALIAKGSIPDHLICAAAAAYFGMSDDDAFCRLIEELESDESHFQRWTRDEGNFLTFRPGLKPFESSFCPKGSGSRAAEAPAN